MTFSSRSSLFFCVLSLRIFQFLQYLFRRNILIPLLNIFSEFIRKITKLIISRLFILSMVAMPDVDNVLTNFYKLDDSARSDVVNMIEALLINHTDPEREKNVKTIKRW